MNWWCINDACCVVAAASLSCLWLCISSHCVLVAIATVVRFAGSSHWHPLRAATDLQATRPDTLGVALHDSPLACTAWLLEKVGLGLTRRGLLA